MLFNLAHSLLSKAKGPRLSIFIFHRVLPEHDPLMPGEPSIDEFDSIIGWIKKDFQIFRLGEALERFPSESEGKPIAALTFDDGYADNFNHALPILRKHGVAATFFIATGYLDGGRMWNDTIIESIRLANTGELDLSRLGLDRYTLSNDAEKLSCIYKLINHCKYLEPTIRSITTNMIGDLCGHKLPQNLMMQSDDLRSMQASGMEIGAHTVTHPILARLSLAEAKVEIDLGREILQGILGTPINYFAYPNGQPKVDYLPEHAEIIKKSGFKAAVSTAWGVMTKQSNIYELPRFTPWDRSPIKFRARTIANSLNTRQKYGY